jgi:hypothetical protein
MDSSFESLGGRSEELFRVLATTQAFKLPFHVSRKFNSFPFAPFLPFEEDHDTVLMNDFFLNK